MEFGEGWWICDRLPDGLSYAKAATDQGAKNKRSAEWYSYQASIDYGRSAGDVDYHTRCDGVIIERLMHIGDFRD